MIAAALSDTIFALAAILMLIIVCDWIAEWLHTRELRREERRRQKWLR